MPQSNPLKSGIAEAVRTGLQGKEAHQLDQAELHPFVNIFFGTLICGFPVPVEKIISHMSERAYSAIHLRCTPAGMGAGVSGP